MKKIKLINNIVSTECVASNYLYFKIRKFFELNNYELVDIFEVDYIIVNTCWVTDSVENQFLDYILDLIEKYWQKSKIIIFWCLPAISKELKEMKDLILIPSKREKLFESIFEHKITLDKLEWADINDNLMKDLMIDNIDSKKTKNYYLHVARWCIHACSYCAIKKSIGFVKSEPLNKVYNEFINAIKNWYNNIILVSDDLWSYWVDIWLSFDVLFNKLCEIEGDYTININYIEPSTFIRIFPKMKHNFWRVNTVHMPIQSWNDRILGLMNRKYTVDSVVALISDLRKFWNPQLRILNHIIYLYPTETYEDFLNSVKVSGYYDNTLFIIYSYRNWLNKIIAEKFTDEEKRKRVIFLKKMAIKYRHKFSLANPF